MLNLQKYRTNNKHAERRFPFDSQQMSLGWGSIEFTKWSMPKNGTYTLMKNEF